MIWLWSIETRKQISSSMTTAGAAQWVALERLPAHHVVMSRLSKWMSLVFAGSTPMWGGCEEAPPSNYTELREKMVEQQLAGPGRNLSDERVLEAMRKVPRHLFVPEDMRRHAYEDRPLPIGHKQTISQPFIVAFMTEAIDVDPGEKVLEIGTGSGYQAAVLAEMGADVYSIEIVEPLAKSAANALEEAGYDNVTVKHGDGYQGWAEHAPFDMVIVTASPDHIPQPLIDQLRVGGKMIIPVGESFSQELIFLEKTETGVERRSILPVRFVPMTGEAQEG